MREYVRDEEGEEHRFRKGDCAVILPHGRRVGEALEMHEYWVGRIRDVRARDANDVWTLVQWYWAPHDLRALRSFDPALCSPYERVFSDTFDYVSTASFDGERLPFPCPIHSLPTATITLHKLNDGDVLQPHIPWDAFYTRYTYEHRARVLTPAPGAYSCLCNVPYAPLAAPLMHFCPRPTCRRFFHAPCLVAADCLDPDTDPNSRRRRLLFASPDDDAQEPAPVSAPARTRRRGRGGGGGGARRGKGRGKTRARAPSPDDALALTSLPPLLIQIASQPIVRGSAWRAGGLSGNLGAVVRARRVVYRALRGGDDGEGEEGEYALEGWETRIDVGSAVVDLQSEDTPSTRTRSAKRPKTAVHGGVQPFVCPQCQGAI
ncbi:hypothetical protein C0992_002082 [Termitomyces sp. T32_za158]|nr:hypothetical protein C0992_002082 [Termitomyces sp. T32_za158]